MPDKLATPFEEFPTDLDEARALKQRLLRDLAADIERLRRRQALSAQRLENASELPRSLALGVAPAPRNGYRIAVRVQRRSIAPDTVQRIRKAAAREVDVRYVGWIGKLQSPPGWMTSRVRPLRIGASIGHHAITAGTLGAFLRRTDDGAIRILSNNHVLANENKAQSGDAILQPGRYDGGTDPDAVATLERFVPLNASGVNVVDAAMARVNDGIGFDLSTLEGGLRLTGVVDLLSVADAAVHKTGRTTGSTEGRVTAFDLDNLVVAYEMGAVRFDDQIEIESTGRGPFSRGGDSGSMVVAASPERPGVALAGALLFAGSDQGGRLGLGLTYANPIGTVLSALDASLAVEEDRPVSTLKQARAAKERVKEMVGSREELRGVGITRQSSGFALKVNLSHATAEIHLPPEVDGVPVIVEIVGEIRALRSTTSTRRASRAG